MCRQGEYIDSGAGDHFKSLYELVRFIKVEPAIEEGLKIPPGSNQGEKETKQ